MLRADGLLSKLSRRHRPGPPGMVVMHASEHLARSPASASRSGRAAIRSELRAPNDSSPKHASHRTMDEQQKLPRRRTSTDSPPSASSPVPARRRRFGWLVVALADHRRRAAVVASVEPQRPGEGAAGADRRRGGRPRRRGTRQSAAAGACRDRHAGRNARRDQLARHGDAARERHRQDAAERHAAGRRVPGRADGQEGRPARADRPASLSRSRCATRKARSRKTRRCCKPPAST